MMRLFLVISTLVISACTTHTVLDTSQYPDFDYQMITSFHPRLQTGEIPKLTACQFDWSCTSSSISTVLNRKFGDIKLEIDVMSGLFNHGSKALIDEREGFSLLDMKQYVESLGYQGNGVMLDRAGFIELFTAPEHRNALPAIILVNYANKKRVVVLSGGNTHYVFIDDPAFGRYKIDFFEFLSILDEEVVFIIDKA
jgi:uncharacterized protein